MPTDLLAVILGFGAAVYVGGLYLWSEDDNREQFQILGALLAVIGAACLAAGVFDRTILLGAVAGLCGAGAILAGKLLASEKSQAYQGMLAVIGVGFLASLGFGLGSVVELNRVFEHKGSATTTTTTLAVQLEQRPHVRGIVSDGAGRPIAKAQVSLRGPLILMAPSVLERTTDDKGAYDFEAPGRGMYELRVVIDGFDNLRQRLSVDQDVDIGALTLKAKPTYDVSAEVMGVTQEAPPTPTTVPAATPTSMPVPTAVPTVASVPCTPPQVAAPVRTSTRVPATATRTVTNNLVPTAVRPQGVGGAVGPITNPQTGLRPAATSTQSATATRIASRTPTRTPVVVQRPCP